MQFTSPNTLPHVPDDITLPQFMLGYAHPELQPPIRPAGVPAFIEDETGRAVSLEEIRDRSTKLATALRKHWNIGDNDVVCIYSPNDVEYLPAIWACHMLGATVTPANPAYTVKELENQLVTSGSTLIFTQPQLLTNVSEAARSANINPDRIVLLKPGLTVCFEDLVKSASNLTQVTYKRLRSGEGKKKIAFLCFSSGTTGKPKAVAISHYNVIANVIQKAVHHQCNNYSTPSETMPIGCVATGVLPFFHIYGLVVTLHFVLYAAMSLVVMPKFNFTDFLNSIVRHRITHLFKRHGISVVPPQVVLLCKHPAVKGYDLSHVRVVTSGAAPLSAELTQQLIELLPGCRIGQGYGATEATGTVAMCPPWQKIGTFGSSGILMAGIEGRVVKPDGSLCNLGEQGELVISGPNIALGYVNDEKATQETFVDGWVHTGDEVIVDKNGEIFVVDRLKEILKVKGFQVAPAELEGHLLDHSDVADACVVSIPDDFSGELPLAFVVLEQSARSRIAKNAAEAEAIRTNLIKYVETTKVEYKWLKGGVQFLDSIPKSPSGKILRRVLRDKARAAKANL